MKTIELDQNNQEQLMAYELISKTNTSFFLTGKAGTGKTTFLKYVKQNVNKNFIILVSIFDLIGVLCLRYFILYAGQLTVA